MRKSWRHAELLRELFVFIELKFLENLSVGDAVKIGARGMEFDIAKVAQPDWLIVG